MNLKSIFEQYLFFSDLPILQLKYEDDLILYRWMANVLDFNMPIKAGLEDDFHFIYPTNEWQSEMVDSNLIENWVADTGRFYIAVEVLSN